MTKMDEESYSTSSQSEKPTELSWWEQRTDLEKALLISATTMIVLIAGILLYTSIRPTAETMEPCHTPGCLTTASEIINNIDTTIDPCKNFFKFTCGKMIENTHGNTDAAPRKRLREQMEWIIKEMLMQPIKDDDHESIKSEKTMFQACMNETALGNQSVDVLNRSLQELNGWPVVVGTAWKDNLFDWTDMIIKLKKRGYIYSTLIDIAIIYKDKFLVYITSPFLPDVEGENKELYKQYMVDTAVMLGATQRRAEEDMQKVLDFMEKLEKISMNDEKGSERRQSVEDFQLYEYEIDWLDLINGIVGAENKISLNDQVVISNYEFLEELLDLIDATPKRIQANYMIWRVVESVTRLLPKEFRELQENYYHLSKQELPWKDRFEDCAKLFIEGFTGLSSVITYARKYLPEAKRQQAQEFFASIKSKFVELLEITHWLDDESKDNTLMKANKINSVIGTYGDYFDDAIFQTPFNSKLINLEGQSFFSMYLNSAATAQNAMFSFLHSQSENATPIYYDHSFLIFPYADYSVHDNELVVPVRFLELSFHPDRPAYTNYASVGFEIGNSLANGFFAPANSDDSNGIWSNTTKGNYKEMQKCIKEDELSLANANDQTKTVAQLASVVEEIAGIKVAYSAYRKWVDENGEEMDLMEINYTPNQLFWISAMLHRCSMFGVQDLGYIFTEYQAKTFATIAFVMYNADFASDFNCAADAEMNRSEKCEVF